MRCSRDFNSEDAFKLVEHDEIEIPLISTPFDEKSVDILLDLGIEKYSIIWIWYCKYTIHSL